MIRHNYLQSPLAAFFGGDTSALRASLRPQLVAAAVGVCFVALAAALEQHRLASLDAQLAVLGQQAAEARSAGARVDRLRAEVMGLEQQREALETARQRSIEATNRVALIGNGLPRQSWLVGVRAQRDGSWMVDGRATELADVGSALRSVARLDRAVPARLIAVSASRDGRVLDFAIRWGTSR